MKCNMVHCAQVHTQEQSELKKGEGKKKGGKKACPTGILYFGKTESVASAEKAGTAFR